MLFARLREEAGRSSVELVLPEGATVMEALYAFASRYPSLGELIFERDGKSLKRTYQVLVSGENVQPAQRRLSEGEVVAIIPPVAGG